MTRHLRYVSLVAVLIAGGCASGGGTPLQQARNSVARELTVQCYWQNEGKRAVFGGYYVHAACRRWADDMVRARMPRDSGWGR